MLGNNAYTDAKVVAALAITDDQKTKLEAVNADFQAQQAELFAGAGGAAGGAAVAVAVAPVAAVVELVAALTRLR